MELMSIPFESAGVPGKIVARLRPNDDPVATGHSRFAHNFDEGAFKGFPMVTAEVEYPGEGPDGWFGWVQLIRHFRDHMLLGQEMDVSPWMTGTPLYVHGYRPTFADAPANPEHQNLEWCADTFLVNVESNRLMPLVGFTWGYRRVAGNETVIVGLAPAPPDAWRRIASTVNEDYAPWRSEL